MKKFEVWTIFATKDEQECGYQTQSCTVVVHRPTGKMYTNNKEMLEHVRLDAWMECTDQQRQFYVDHKVQCTMKMNNARTAMGIIWAERMDRVPAVISKYDIKQHYGGPEEGGWYYHTRRLIQTEQVWETPFLWSNTNTDRYGEGNADYVEVVHGEHHNVERQFYF